MNMNLSQVFYYINNQLYFCFSTHTKHEYELKSSILFTLIINYISAFHVCNNAICVNEYPYYLPLDFYVHAAAK